MSRKIGRNEKCFCGSGKKFKKCHGAANAENLTKASFEFVDVRFVERFFKMARRGVKLSCKIYAKNNSFYLLMFISQRDDGKWVLLGRQWIGQRPNLEEKDFLQTMINKASSLMTTTNLWAGEQTSAGGKMIINQIKVADENIKYNSISFRASLLSLPYLSWQTLWERIDERVKNDPSFRIHGFTTPEIKAGIVSLKKFFPWEWVRSQYRKSLLEDEPSMGADFPPEVENATWFPAYHLARTALGAICVDPGWNYLLEIGLSIGELEHFPKVKKLAQQLSRSPGTQHHLCLAAELHKRGLLRDLEPPTGAGSATNDLLLEYRHQKYSVEVKEFNLNNPLSKLKLELRKKVAKVPSGNRTPIIFHIVLREDGEREIRRERDFFNALDGIIGEMPTQISAVVAGTRFVDSTGGRVKRETAKILINPSADNPSELENIQEIFKNNFEEVIYPASGIGTFFYFENSQK